MRERISFHRRSGGEKLEKYQAARARSGVLEATRWMQYGLLRGSFTPARPIRELRT